MLMSLLGCQNEPSSLVANHRDHEVLEKGIRKVGKAR